MDIQHYIKEYGSKAVDYAFEKLDKNKKLDLTKSKVAELCKEYNERNKE